MKDIYVIGAGGLALEVLFLIEDINKEKMKYIFKGFIDREEGKLNGYQVFKEEDFLSNVDSKNSCFAFGIGEPNLVSKLSLKYNDLEFPNLVHPNFVGDRNGIQMGKGNVVTAGCIFTTAINIGNFNLFNLNVTVGHDVRIGNGNIINPCVNISGGVNIGNNNLIGVGAIILQYKSVGNDSVIGAASLVSKNVDSNVVVLGVPAKVLRANNLK